MEKENNIPKPGTEYHFFDDGKTSPSRHYICRCERLATVEEAKNIMFGSDVISSEKETISLYELWEKAVLHYYWVFAEVTDLFVEISCPGYDENNLWAARAKDGGWFTLDIQSFWQAGRVDVTGEIFENVLKSFKEEENEEMVNAYLQEKYDWRSVKNKEQASKIYRNYRNETVYFAAMKMAEWKDEQFDEEKKQWIEKASNYIYNNAHVTTFHDIRLDRCSITQFVEEFRKAMEE